MAKKKEELNKAELADLVNMMNQSTVQAASIEPFIQLREKLTRMAQEAPEPPPPPMPPGNA